MQRCSPRCRRQNRSCPRSWSRPTTRCGRSWAPSITIGCRSNSIPSTNWSPRFPQAFPASCCGTRERKAAPAAVLSRLQLHSDRLAVIVLDSPENAASWARAIEKRQVAAHVSLPIAADTLSDALKRAREEIDARVALLGVARTPTAPSQGGGSKKTALVIGVVALAAAAGAGVFLWQRQQVPAEAAKQSATAAQANQAATREGRRIEGR
jgi:hypothetical protein